MIDDSLISRLPKTVAVHQDARLHDFTTFKLGGSCPALIDCPTASALCVGAAEAPRIAARAWRSKWPLGPATMTLGTKSLANLGLSRFFCVVLLINVSLIP